MLLSNILVLSLSVRVHCGLTRQKWLISFKNLLLIISIFFFISVWEVLEGGEEVAPGRVRAGALFNENQSHREDSHCSTTLWCTSNEQKERIFSAARCRCSNEKKAMQCNVSLPWRVVHFYSGAVRGNPLFTRGSLWCRRSRIWCIEPTANWWIYRRCTNTTSCNKVLPLTLKPCFTILGVDLLWWLHWGN